MFLGIIIGFIGGTITGLFLMSFVTIAKTSEEQIRRYEEKHKDD